MLCTAGANAGIISFADTFGPAAVPFPSAPLVTLSLFDPALGTLTKVTLTLDANTSGGRIAWDNEAPFETDVTLGIGARVTAVGLGGITLVAVPLQIGSAVGIAADNDGAADFVGTDSFSVVGGSGSDSDMAMLTTGFGVYIGLGTFDVDVSAIVETFLSTTGGYGPIDPVPGNTDGTVTVTYEFSSIPEPSTALLLASGLAALAVRSGIRRRGW
ncbi:MAG: choice-of-anchor E domain-containing protein [Planctomycetes bacterium]|nr:choice-of-anchor E domain-containing protein [Planctomycetota bacterium]